MTAHGRATRAILARVNLSSWTARLVIAVVGGIIIAAVIDVVDKVARGHWASIGHLIIVAIIGAVIVAFVPIPQLRR